MSIVQTFKLLVSVFFTFSLLVSCSENKINKEELILECKGKRTYRGSSSNWSNEKISTYEISEVYEFSKFIGIKNNYEWSFSDTKRVHLNSDGKNVIDSKKFENYTNIVVGEKEIFVTISGSSDFDPDEKIKPSNNQKNQYSREIIINRISGIWDEKDINKTIWKDGSTLNMNYFTTGKCEKGTKKF
jgi:hypothetical protein